MYLSTLFNLDFIGIPSTGINEGVKAVEKPKAVAAGPISDVDADLEARLDNLRRQ